MPDLLVGAVVLLAIGALYVLGWLADAADDDDRGPGDIATG